MKQRWKDRIQILLNCPPSYDAWGHASENSSEQTAEIWAEVIPIIGSVSTARVTVLAPFDYDERIHIRWQNQCWKIIHAPIQLPNTQLIQFKIERL